MVDQIQANEINQPSFYTVPAFMITNLTLSQFRGIESVQFDKLGRINIIVGGNNTGKTSILEALVLLFGNQAQLETLPSTFRATTPKSKIDSTNRLSSFWPMLIKKGHSIDFEIRSDSSAISVSKGMIAKYGFYHTLDGIEYPEPLIQFIDDNTSGFFNVIDTPKLKLAILPTSQPDPLATSKLFNEIAPLNPDNETKIQDLLRESIEPRLRRLRYAQPKGASEHLIYVDLGNGPMIPFTQMGQAFARTLHIYCEIFASNPDILLVDEIENGLYYKGLEDFWKGLAIVLKDQDIQLFATTHSRECMNAAHAAMSGNEYTKEELCYLRLDRHVDEPDKIVGTRFDSYAMAAAAQFGQEMR